MHTENVNLLKTCTKKRTVFGCKDKNRTQEEKFCKKRGQCQKEIRHFKLNMAVHARACDLFYKIAQSLRTCKNFRFISSATSIPEMIKSNSEMFSGEIDKKFRDSRVQNLLTRLAERSLEFDKVFKPRQETLQVPTYKLLTDEELLEVCCGLMIAI